jgi:hypothetical protein
MGLITITGGAGSGFTLITTESIASVPEWQPETSEALIYTFEYVVTSYAVGGVIIVAVAKSIAVLNSNVAPAEAIAMSVKSKVTGVAEQTAVSLPVTVTVTVGNGMGVTVKNTTLSQSSCVAFAASVVVMLGMV